MREIIFKVAPTGEGKTKWLLDIAKHCSDTGVDVYLYINEPEEYVRFCRKYFNLYSSVCPVKALQHIPLDVLSTSVILVDDLMSHSANIGDIKFLQRSCGQLFVTITGKLGVEQGGI